MEYIYLSECESTNDYAKNLLEQNQVKSETCIHSDYQSKGRGQVNAVWESNKANNLLFSLIFETKIEIDLIFCLNISVSMVLKETLENILKTNVKIKWPNDIYVNQKKIAGMLIENKIRGKEVVFSILGIGLNVNQLNFKNPNACSIFQILKSETNRTDLLELISNKISNELKILNVNRFYFENNKAKYLNSLLDFNTEKSFFDKNGEFVGKIIDIKKDGKLVIQSGQKTNEYYFKEVSQF